MASHSFAQTRPNSAAKKIENEYHTLEFEKLCFCMEYQIFCTIKFPYSDQMFLTSLRDLTFDSMETAIKIFSIIKQRFHQMSHELRDLHTKPKELVLVFDSKE